MYFALTSLPSAISTRPVELRQHHGLPKLTIVDQVAGIFVVDINSHIEAGKYLLIDANIVVI